MLKAELETLIRTSLASLGAAEVNSAPGIVRYQLTDGLSQRLGRREMAITFNPAVAAHNPDVELVAAGSFLYDLVLRLVRERGRAAAGWLPARPDVDAPALIARAAVRLKERRFVKLRDAWGSVYLLTFRIGFFSDTPQERLYSVRVDLERERVRHEVHPWKLIQAAQTDPPQPGLAPGRRDPERAFRMAWARVEEEVARLTERFSRQGEARLKEDVQTIELYYRQLIEEEKLAREQKNTRRGRADSEARIEVLKLEWERRVAEEKQRFSPEASVLLSCASCLQAPLQKWRAKAGRGRREGAVDFWVDLHSGDVWPARAARRRPRAGPAGPS